MRRAAVVLMHLYLIARMVFCPCLSGQNVHDRATRSLFAWSGAASVPIDDLSNPEDVSTEAGACMCDGADTPSCPDCPPADTVGVSIDPPDDAPALISCLGLDGLAPGHPPPHPIERPSPDDAPTVRARLQNFRC